MKVWRMKVSLMTEQEQAAHEGLRIVDGPSLWRRRHSG